MKRRPRGAVSGGRNETLGNHASCANFRTLMKIFSLIAAVFALSFNACEQHPVSELPEHYQHKAGAHHDEAKPAEGEHPAKH